MSMTTIFKVSAPIDKCQGVGALQEYGYFRFYQAAVEAARGRGVMGTDANIYPFKAELISATKARLIEREDCQPCGFCKTETDGSTKVVVLT